MELQLSLPKYNISFPLKKIFYSFPNFASFVQKDLAVLQQRHAVRTFTFVTAPKWVLPFTMVVQFFHLVWHGFTSDILLTQFAGYQSVLPTLFAKLLKKKHIIVLGGTDCNWLPSIHYGNFHKPLLRKATVFSLQHADLLLPVSKELVYCPYTYTNEDGMCQGYTCFFPEIKTPYRVIPNGIPLANFPFSTTTRLQDSFITTCSELHDLRRQKVKGIDLILTMASSLPQIHVMLLGGVLPNHQTHSSVQTIPFAGQDTIASILGKYQFYVQLSMTEGFPNALIEAMACGCVPIVSNVGAMPEIIANTGYVLEKKDAGLLIALLQKAMAEYKPEKALAARKRAEQFSIENRAAQLLDAVECPEITA
jgi:glycosyltransferase involved in cell wall biosynthesis